MPLAQELLPVVEVEFTCDDGEEPPWDCCERLQAAAKCNHINEQIEKAKKAGKPGLRMKSSRQMDRLRPIKEAYQAAYRRAWKHGDNNKYTDDCMPKQSELPPEVNADHMLDTVACGSSIGPFAAMNNRPNDQMGSQLQRARPRKPEDKRTFKEATLAAVSMNCGPAPKCTHRPKHKNFKCPS
jgi:hypothetical protein